ncbi:putative orfan [Tupanvirus soda lake]|uniref:Orfan n=2 Tax=Tupanvirus TaxID=2094720 RepID=A0AC62ABG8_9VIRU|nr:putative orfan [Tupanvirus soda lake]QKU35096.1 putative orfan [Tupanvirus soda lake]
MEQTITSIYSFINKFNNLSTEQKNFIYDHCDFPFSDKNPCGADTDLCVSLRELLHNKKISLELFSTIPYIRYTSEHILQRVNQLLTCLDNPAYDVLDGNTN